jgi:hypothetical protein
MHDFSRLVHILDFLDRFLEKNSFGFSVHWSPCNLKVRISNCILQIFYFYFFTFFLMIILFSTELIVGIFMSLLMQKVKNTLLGQ